VNPFLVYLLLLKATLLSFSGLGGLPIVRHDFVERYGVLTDNQLNAAVAAGQAAPGPNGLYIAGVGYFVAGVPGAVAGSLASMTPAFLIILMLRYVGRRAGHPRVRGVIHAVMLAAAGLIVDAAVPLARAALTSPAAWVISAAAFVYLAGTGKPTFWAVLGSAAAGALLEMLR
jgi:chromate transporter